MILASYGCNLNHESVLGVELPEASRGVVSTSNNQKLISDIDPRDLGLQLDTTNFGVTELILEVKESDDLGFQPDTDAGVSENDNGFEVEHREASGSGSELKQERVEISEVATIEKVGGIFLTVLQQRRHVIEIFFHSLQSRSL
jgi:hypothetical protein